mgnify:CR=1 FL=1
MKPSDLRAKDMAQLKQELNDLLKAQFSLRMQIATQQRSGVFFDRRQAARLQEQDFLAVFHQRI